MTPPPEIGRRVLISDRHIGTTLWQRAALESAGIPVTAHTLSNHRHYAPPGTLLKSRLLDNVHRIGPRSARLLARLSPELLGVTHLLCSFPPARLLDLEKLPGRFRIIVNMGHRFHIHLPREQLLAFGEQLSELSRDPRFILASMSRYDVHYTRYYTDIDEIAEMPVVCAHIAPELRKRVYAPENRTILIGPSHNEGDLLTFGSLDEMNEASRRYASRAGREPYTFDFIGRRYPAGNATFEKLARHPAVLMIPYSAFSISMIELYQLNLPFFVPSDDLLVDRMADVRLAPIYFEADDVRRLDESNEDRGRKRGYPFSPNDPAEAAQRYWMRFMYFNQVRHAVRFDSDDGFFRKLYETDLVAQAAAMQRENTELFGKQVGAWRRIVS